MVNLDLEVLDTILKKIVGNITEQRKSWQELPVIVQIRMRMINRDSAFESPNRQIPIR